MAWIEAYSRALRRQRLADTGGGSDLPARAEVAVRGAPASVSH